MNKRILVCSVTGLLGVFACLPSADESMPEGSEFVPPRDTDVLIAELIYTPEGIASIGAPENLPKDATTTTNLISRLMAPDFGTRSMTPKTIRRIFGVMTSPLPVSLE